MTKRELATAKKSIRSNQRSAIKNRQLVSFSTNAYALDKETVRLNKVRRKEDKAAIKAQKKNLKAQAKALRKNK